MKRTLCLALVIAQVQACSPEKDQTAATRQEITSTPGGAPPSGDPSADLRATHSSAPAPSVQTAPNPSAPSQAARTTVSRAVPFFFRQLPRLDESFSDPSATDENALANFTVFANADGAATSLSTQGQIDVQNAFFQSLGTNDRSCASCHDPRAGWSITPRFARFRFAATDGLAPLFRSVDGANAPNADVSTVRAREQAYSMLLTKGLIRIGLPMPRVAEFELLEVRDPYHYASARELSLFRRPLPATNLRFSTVVMWDGRESQHPHLQDKLLTQAQSATLSHAEGMALAVPIRQAIVDFELSLFSSQVLLPELPVSLPGPEGLSRLTFVPGMNQPGSSTFDPDVFTLFTSWRNDPHPLKASIARGEQIFNRRSFVVSGVGGLNDRLGLPQLPTTCSSCHNTPQVGSSSGSALMDLGLSRPSERTRDMPVYTLRHKQSGTLLETTDPGLALITGQWADINKFKVPGLRNLAARPPYFHNGSAPDLQAVVRFYDRRFSIGLTEQERADLLAFLRAL